MPPNARRKHRADVSPDRAHAKAGLAAVAASITVVTVILVSAGSLFASSGASPWWHRHHHTWPTRTSTATSTATVTAPGPTATKTVAGPTATATATKTVTAPPSTSTPSWPPTSTPTWTPTSSPTGTPGGGAQLPYVGAAVGGNSDPSALEKGAGRVLGLHRTYWNYSNISSSIKSATADAKAGRIPWLSYKLNVSWSAAAAGKADAATRDLASRLATVPGPVWVALHHEPEGDGNLADWVAMQKRLLPILAADKNVRTSIILTGWDTFDSGNSAYSLYNLWPGKMVSILGIDVYNRYGDATHTTTGWTEMSHFYDEIAPAAKRLGVDWAIAETGYTDAAAAKDPDWLTRAYNDMADRTDLPGIGLCYFDSSANSSGTWPLTGVKDTKFDAILRRSHAVG